MDITPDFSKLLHSKGCAIAKHGLDVETVEGFVKEAYRINSRISSLHQELKDVRRAYLSATQPRRTHNRNASNQPRALTDREREEIDANAKSMLRELNSSIGILEDAETLRRKTETELILKKHSSGLGVLGAWASGGAVGKKSVDQLNAEAQAEQTAGHRDGVLWYLRKQLESCLRTQQDMMETRLSREYELSRSMLSQAGPSLADFAEFKPMSHVSSDSREQDNSSAIDQGLSAEQIQMFEEGNQDMMTHFDSALDKVKGVEKSLREISELQSLLVTNLATQSAHIEQLVADSEFTTENVGGGNKELTKATQRPSAARYTFFAASGLCAFVILWDLII
ncbi:hypothetical protein NLU13_4797 [Sarocladium strictum]|uniref:SNARE-complex protein Syntaxin-18 N-terminal domain-containing protein n=1 Tax=Sarocladium strictum TaxID=5046 RepID=A0AA39GL98_SARSR|nr:hypothetical protein NLU13_4797 [Sarocladium strictum]